VILDASGQPIRGLRYAPYSDATLRLWEKKAVEDAMHRPFYEPLVVDQYGNNALLRQGGDPIKVKFGYDLSNEPNP